MYNVRYQQTKYGGIIRGANNLTEEQKDKYISTLPKSGIITVLKKVGNRWYIINK